MYFRQNLKKVKHNTLIFWSKCCLLLSVFESSKQRREAILSAVMERRHVTPKDLAIHLDVSEATVRRDLKALADEGRLELVYGGATLPRAGDFSFQSKLARNAEGKRMIGKLAAELVSDGDQIFVDSGTTCYEMAPFLKRRRGLSVIANSARLAMELDVAGISVILIGGQFRRDRMDTVGPLAASSLDQLRGYVAFIGSDGISMEFGPAAADIESADIYRRAVRNARETVLLVDHSKFSSPSLFKIVDWNAIKRLVTDRPVDREWNEFLRTRGIEVIHPPAVESFANHQAHGEHPEESEDGRGISG